MKPEMILPCAVCQRPMSVIGYHLQICANANCPELWRITKVDYEGVSKMKINKIHMRNNIPFLRDGTIETWCGYSAKWENTTTSIDAVTCSRCELLIQVSDRK